MIDYTIKVENKFVGDAITLFFDNYKEHVATFLTNVLKNETGSADAYIQKADNGQLEVYQTAPDKGIVMGQLESGGEVKIHQYKDLPVDSKYVVFDGQNLMLCLKQADGIPDLKIGRFANFNDAVSQIDSESVKTTIETIKASIKNAEIDRKNVEKKAAKLRKSMKAQV